jgi:hypothetical protein
MDFTETLKNILDGEDLSDLIILRDKYKTLRPKTENTKKIITEITRRIDTLEPNTFGARIRKLLNK